MKGGYINVTSDVTSDVTLIFFTGIPILYVQHMYYINICSTYVNADNVASYGDICSTNVTFTYI